MLSAAQIELWLAEDLGSGDVTSALVIPEGARCSATLLAREHGVVSGLGACEAVLAVLDPGVAFEPLCADGDPIEAQALARLEGSARSILAGERVALNLLGRLSGIASLTRRFVDAVAGTSATILDTRKTTPGLRALEKLAVEHGGGTNHRFGLADGVLLKENHLRLAGGVRRAVERASRGPLPVEVECETLAEVTEALAAGAQRILLDNMGVAELHAAVALVGGAVELEASGGITLANVRAVAETGVDLISIGALTHSAPALDVSLEVHA